MSRDPAPVSPDRSAKRRIVLSLLLKRAQTATNRRIANELEIDESTLSRWREEHLPRAVDFVLTVGCKIVPAELICMDPREKAALEYYAEIGMQAKRAEQPRLVDDWED